MKRIGIVGGLILFVFTTYCLGYYKGVNDASFLLSSTKAALQIHTINYINQGKYEKAKELNLIDVESSVAAVEDIYALQGNFTKIPRRALFYLKSFSVTQGFMTEQLNILKPRYEKLKAEAKHN